MTGAEMLRQALGLDGSPPRRRRHASRAPAGPPTSCSKAVHRLTEPRPTNPEGFDGELRSYQAEALGVARVPRRRRARRLPGPRHGPGQDPHDARPPRPATGGDGPRWSIAPPAVVGNWAAEAAQFTPGLKVRRAPRRRPRRATTRSPREVADADVVITTYATAVRDMDALAKIAVGPRRARRGPGHQEPGQRHRAAAAPAQRPQPPRPHRHARSRTASATSGPSSTSPTRASSAPGRSSSPSSRATARRPGPGRAGPAGAQRHPRVPPHQGRARDRRRAARPHRRARPLRHDPRADRPLPGRARQPASPGRPPRTAPTPSKGQVLAAITALKQICNHPAAYRDDDGRRSPAARASSARLEEIVEQVFAAERAGADLHPLRRVGREARRPPHRALRHRRSSCYHGGLARGARDTHDRGVPGRSRAPARWCCR